jgi:hypothetical protein
MAGAVAEIIFIGYRSGGGWSDRLTVARLIPDDPGRPREAPARRRDAYAYRAAPDPYRTSRRHAAGLRHL